MRTWRNTCAPPWTTFALEPRRPMYLENSEPQLDMAENALEGQLKSSPHRDWCHESGLLQWDCSACSADEGGGTPKMSSLYVMSQKPCKYAEP